MRIITMWGMRKGESLPELMVAWDEFCKDSYEEGFDWECASARESWGDELVSWRIVEIEIPLSSIESAFGPPLVEGAARGITDVD